MWVSLVDSVQQSLIRVCPFLYRFWSKMNLCACFSSYQSVMKLLLQCCGGSGAVATEQRKWGAGLTCQGLLGRAHCPQLLGFERCAAQLRLSWICRIHLKKHLRFPWWCSEPKELPCRVPRSWAGAGWQVGGTAGRRQTAFSSHRSLPRQEAWGGWQFKNWDDVGILHFPELVFAFCVMQNDCNWECIWNKLPLWLSNISTLLFMFICQVCNSYKLLLHDKLLHLNFSLLNSSSSLISLAA